MQDSHSIVGKTAAWQSLILRTQSLILCLLLPVLLVACGSVSETSKTASEPSKVASKTSKKAPEPEEEEEGQVYQTKPGERKTVTLADGSTVILQGNTRLVLSPEFSSENRDAKLDGEAYFEVTKGEHEFRIKAGRAEIASKQSHFNLQIRDGRAKLNCNQRWTSISGRTKSGSLNMNLRAGEYTSYRRKSGFEMRKRFNPDYWPLWAENTFLFNGDESLEFVCGLMEDHFGVSIQVDPGIADKKVDGHFHHDTAEEMLASLSESVEVNWFTEDDIFYFE